jgi:hypothetical protein
VPVECHECNSGGLGKAEADLDHAPGLARVVNNDPIGYKVVNARNRNVVDILIPEKLNFLYDVILFWGVLPETPGYPPSFCCIYVTGLCIRSGNVFRFVRIESVTPSG